MSRLMRTIVFALFVLVLMTALSSCSGWHCTTVTSSWWSIQLDDDTEITWGETEHIHQH